VATVEHPGAEGVGCQFEAVGVAQLPFTQQAQFARHPHEPAPATPPTGRHPLQQGELGRCGQLDPDPLPQLGAGMGDDQSGVEFEFRPRAEPDVEVDGRGHAVGAVHLGGALVEQHRPAAGSQLDP
jgi:hypothetical protein